MPAFTRAVHEFRLGMMHSLMDREGLDALVFTRGDYVLFATNLPSDVEVWERPVAFVLPREGRPFLMIHELSQNMFRFSREAGRLWMEEATIYAEHPVTAGRLPLIHETPAILRDALAERGLATSRIGVDAMARLVQDAAAMLPGATFRQMEAELRSLRWVKHEEELQAMRDACALTDWLQDRYRENIRPGRLVQELDMHMASLFYEEAARRFPGDDIILPECFSLAGPASASPHGDGAQCGARIQKGDVLVNIIIPRINGLYVENERTWFAGAPSTDQRRYYALAREANEAASEAAVTGNPVSAIDAAALRVFERAGCEHLVCHRTGHGIGILGHEYPEDMPFNRRALLTNEVYSSEPGIYVYGLGGFRIDDMVIVGPEPEIITKSSRAIEDQIVG